jgi:hypothetical protein
MNPLPEHLTTGTFGELLVQLRLLQYEVQAAPPLKDTGNDLIAIRGQVFKAIQVKTRTTDQFGLGELPKRYDLLAIVALSANGDEVALDHTQVFLVPREEADALSTCTTESLAEWRLNAELADALFGS